MRKLFCECCGDPFEIEDDVFGVYSCPPCERGDKPCNAANVNIENYQRED